MKRFLAVALSIVLFITASLPAFAADTPEKEVAIIVPGLMETLLYFENSSGSRRRFFDPARDYFDNEDNIKKLILGVVKALFLFSYKTLDESLIEINDAALGGLAMNRDGTSVNTVNPAASRASECSVSALKQSGKWSSVDQGAMFALTLADKIGPENVFVFLYDWRLNAADLAEKLEVFVNETKQVTGADKVNIITNSYGAQIAATYLYDLGGCANVNRVVFNAPAWQGTSLCRYICEDNIKDMQFSLMDGMHFILRFLLLDYDFEPLVRLLPKRLVDEVYFALARNTFTQYMLYMPAYWCCMDIDDYDTLKEQLLDPELDADFIAKNDAVQYGIMRRIPEVLDYIQSQGTKVAITASDGNKLFMGGDTNGDYVVEISRATGAEAMPLGKRFPDGRTGKYVSPSGGVDLTNGLLPDRTWVITGQAHCQTYWDEASATLIPKLLLTDEIEDVFSSPDFPQFMDSRCPAMDVSLTLEGKMEKTLVPADGKIKAVIKNESDADVIITGVSLCGIPYVTGPVAGKLKAGETKTVPLAPSIFGKTCDYGTIKVFYIDTGILPQIESRTFAFKVA